MNISLLLNGDSTSLDTLKYCALYFDKITLDEPIYIHTMNRIGKKKPKNKKHLYDVHFLRLFDLSLKDQIEVLKKEGIARTAFAVNTDSIFHKKLSKNAQKRINSLAKAVVGMNLKKLFDPKGISPIHTKGKRSSVHIEGRPKIICDEAKEAFENLFSEEELSDVTKCIFDNNPNSPIELYCLSNLYLCMFEYIFCHLCLGESVASNSNFVNEIIHSIFQEQTETRMPNMLRNQIALDCVTILLPHIRNVSMEDILELRYQANDELMELRNYIDVFLRSLSVDAVLELSVDEIELLVKQKIEPSIRQLERKMKSIRLTAIQNAMKNPTVYVPFVTSAFSNMPQQVGLLSSLSLIAADTFIEFRKNQMELENDALFFTIKLRNQLRSQ